MKFRNLPSRRILRTPWVPGADRWGKLEFDFHDIYIRPGCHWPVCIFRFGCRASILHICSESAHAAYDINALERHRRAICGTGAWANKISITSEGSWPVGVARVPSRMHLPEQFGGKFALRILRAPWGPRDGRNWNLSA